VKKLRILQVNKYYTPVIGGVERVVQDLSEGLRDIADVQVLVCSQKGKTTRDLINGVEVVYAASPGKLFSMPLSISFLREFQKLAANADIVQFHMPFPLGDFGYLLSSYRGKVAVYWHSDVVRQKKLLRVYKPMMNAFLKRADVIMAATPGHFENSEQLAPYKDKCVVVPYGINADEYTQSASCDRILPVKKDGIAEVLFVGRLVYYKGVDVLLKSMAQVQNVRLTIVGDGPLKEDLLVLSKELGIEDMVFFLGQRSDADVAACMRDCDIFVLPSVHNSEAFGLVQLQAMCFAKPVINTNLPTGVPYVSVHEQTGLTVPPGDPAMLAIAIRKLAQDAAYAKQLGQGGAQRVRTCFGMENMIGGIFAQYRKLMEMEEK
jgi:glycosyltransferase involved in cell wall biosynthesis